MGSPSFTSTSAIVKSVSAAAFVVREHPGQELARGVLSDSTSPLATTAPTARFDGLLLLGEHVQRRVVLVAAEVTEVRELVHRRGREREALRTSNGVDDVVGGEHGRHGAGVVDHDVGHVEIPGRRREGDGHDPCFAGDAAHAADVPHVEEATEVLAELLGDRLPDLLALHVALERITARVQRRPSSVVTPQRAGETLPVHTSWGDSRGNPVNVVGDWEVIRLNSRPLPGDCLS